MSEKKERIAFFDTKPYDRKWFDQLNQHYHIKYYEHKLTPDSISLAQGCRAVIPFVNDTLDTTNKYTQDKEECIYVRSNKGN